MGDLPACCMSFDISYTDLLFPERMAPDGWEFLQAHDISRMTITELQSRSVDMGKGIVKIKHRCAQLQNDGRCGIYASRPQICRDFDCSTQDRSECFCGGRGNFVPVAQIAAPAANNEDGDE